MEEAKPKRIVPTNAQRKKTEDILDEAVRQLRNTVYGNYLLEKYPLRRTDKLNYPEANAVLREVGSPAMTDGKSVYVDTEIMANMLVQEYPALALKAGVYRSELRKSEDYWTLTKLDENQKTKLTSSSGEGFNESYAVDEIRDIILHELTHALNEHSKVSARAEARGADAEYMAKLAVACELQANDGIMGYEYSRNLLQRQPGVTNKRLHPETAGCHTLREFMDKIKLNEREQRNAMTKELAQAMNNTVRMAKATGEYKKVKQEAEEQAARQAAQAQSDSDSEDKDGNMLMPGCGKMQEDDSIDDTKTSNTKIAAELEKAGMAQVKQLLLEALSDQLRYDPNTDSVFFDETIRRVPRRTYARPSRKSVVNGGYTLLKKGVAYDRVHEPNKANKLTVLAVDASGSMTGQQQYVAAILDDLLEQAAKVAREHKLEVHYENLMCTLHRTTAKPLVPATSDEWKYTMARYNANGGNDFDCVMKAVSPAMNKKDYDAVTIINLSDGLDELSDYERWPAVVRDMYEQNKLSWVDALISDNPSMLTEANNCLRYDDVPIRKQVVLKVIRK